MKKLLKKIFYSLPASYTLMFHHIDDGKIIKKSGCVLDKDSFIKIVDSGLDFISIDELFNTSIKKRNKCVVTFDDGLQDVYRIAYPELKNRGIPFTIFIVVDFLDTYGYITTEELCEMAKDPLVTIGSHGMSHDVLKGMDPKQQEKEILCSKNVLENILNRQIKYFAYSHGQYDDSTLSILRKSKCYDYVFGVSGYPTNIYTKSWKYYLPRLNCENGQSHFYVDSTQKKAKIKFNYR